LPRDKSVYGYLSEHHTFGETDEIAGEFAEDLAATMLASSLGIPFDPDQDYNARKDIFLLSKKVVKTRNVTQSAKGHKSGLWTSVLAAAVFRMD
jgi:arginine decarboxylase